MPGISDLNFNFTLKRSAAKAAERRLGPRQRGVDFIDLVRDNGSHAAIYCSAGL